MKTPKIYTAKTLYSGYKLGLLNDKMYVGVPGGQTYEHKDNFKDEKNFVVQYDGKSMHIRSWYKGEKQMKFPDHQGRGDYWLSYFKWNPKEDEVILSPIAAMASAPLPSNWEETRKKLHE